MDFIRFLNADTGFALVMDDWNSSPLYSVHRTVDGATSWQRVAETSLGPWKGLDFADARSGYAVGQAGAFLRTVDGGATWDGSITIGPALDVDFTSPETGYVVGDYGYAAKTMDGGATWNPLNVMGTSVQFPHADTGYVLNGYALHSTVDGGTTWDTILANGNAIGLHSFRFLDGRLGYGMGTANASLKSVDGGATWTELPWTARCRVQKVFFSTAEIGYAVCTYDEYAGLWRRVPTAPGKDENTLRAPLMLAMGDLPSIYYTAIFKTANGGADWNIEYHVSDLEQNLYVSPRSLQCPDARTCYLLGNNGTILKRAGR